MSPFSSQASLLVGPPCKLPAQKKGKEVEDNEKIEGSDAILVSKLVYHRQTTIRRDGQIFVFLSFVDQAVLLSFENPLLEKQSLDSENSLLTWIP